MSEEVIDTIVKNESSAPTSEEKTRALIAHLTIIGLVIAYVQNQNENKSEYASFYIRQMIGLAVVSFAAGIFSSVPFIGWVVGPIISLALLVFWIISIVSANSGEKKPLPLLGDKFQEWFKSV